MWTDYRYHGNECPECGGLHTYMLQQNEGKEFRLYCTHCEHTVSNEEG